MSEPLIKTPCVFGENGNFLLERELGAGGMGGVYMGRDKMLDRPVAVKVMQKEFGSDAEFVEKFKREAQSAARLIHPNIAQVYSYGICDGMPYIAMELAAGGSLYTIMKATPGKTDVARVIKICQQVAQALQCSSDQGCVHGDVKPENILLDANGNAKLVDFGLAAMQKDTTEIWGTPYYISPEKVRKEPIDFRADMYSLGGTLYHALTGVAPFEGDDSIAVVKKRFDGPPRKPSEVRPDLTPAIDELVLKMLALEKEARYPSFEALIEAFKSVLTSGLTAAKPAAVAAPAAKKPAATGARRLTTVRGRRMAMAKRPGTTLKKKPAEDSGDEEESPDVKPIDLASVDEADEEEGGNLGAKVAAAVVGGILLIGGVIGALVWYQVADKKARAAEEQAQISTGIEKARGAISGTLTSANKFADEFDAFAARAVEACQKPTDALRKIIPEEQAALLKPPQSKELLDAIASTNEALQAAAAAATNATAAAASTNSVAPAAAAPAAAAPKLPQFRPPTEEEMDPASPEGEKYREERKKFEAEQLAKLRAGAKKPKDEPAEQPAEQPAGEAGKANEEAEAKKKAAETAQIVVTMNELWERAYGCQASAIRIRKSIREVIKKGEEADELKGETRENMDKLAELSRTLVEMLEKVKISKDVENVRKGISYIKSRGEKAVEQTVKRLRIEKLEAERKAKAEAEAKAEQERLERLAAERKAKVEEETAGAKAKFDAIVAQGCLRQLDWKTALRLLQTAKDSMTTPEGQLAYDFEIRKVNDMKFMHDIFIKNLVGYVFKTRIGRNKDKIATQPIEKCKVKTVNEKEIILVKPDGKSKLKIFWQKFYKDYPGNLNELINAFIYNTRGPNSKIRLNLREWSDAMTGAALTMQLVCSEVNGAMERSEFLIKEVVKQLPEYQKVAQDIFPAIKFEAAAEE